MSNDISNELIVVRQLPIIEEQLKTAQTEVKKRVTFALSMACTEETYKDIKKIRAELSKEHTALEKRRIEIKRMILAPYQQFEDTYKELIGSLYDDADNELASKITEVTDGIKAQRTDEVKAFFCEYRKSVGVPEDIISYEKSGIKVNLSDSIKSLKDRCKGVLDRISGELGMIETLPDKDEVLMEYRKSLDVSAAVKTVADRKAAIEAERRRREAEAAAKAAAKAAKENAAAKVAEIVAEEKSVHSEPAVLPIEIEIPKVEEAPAEINAEPILELKFTVRSTKTKLKALKAFLIEGGYEYE